MQIHPLCINLEYYIYRLHELKTLKVVLRHQSVEFVDIKVDISEKGFVIVIVCRL